MSKRLLIVILFLLPVVGYGSHMRGGEIRVVSTNGLACVIEMRLYTNTSSEIRPGEGIFLFGDGTNVTTEDRSSIIVTGQPNLGMVVYTFEHTYTAAGLYVLSYEEPNLTLGILNMFNSVETRFYIESSIVISEEHPFSSPRFPTAPIFLFPSHRTYTFSTAAMDDSTSNDFFYKYELVAQPKNIRNYQIPENLTLNQENGTITWDTKFNGEFMAGLYLFFVKVSRYSAQGFQGYVSRALQITVEDSNSQIDLTSSVTEANNKVVVTEGQEKKIKVIFRDINPVSTFDVYFNKVIKKNIAVIQYDSVAGDIKLRVAVLSLKTTSDVISDLPYPITLRGHSNYGKDITFLYMTKEVNLPVAIPEPDLPHQPEIILGLLYQEGLKIHPNPFRSEIYIDGSASTEAVFINSLGQVMMRTHVNQGQPLNTTSLPAGIYLLQIADENGATRNFKVLRE